jgi:hypothetical protein
VAVRSSTRRRDLVAFGAALAPGVAAIALVNAFLYGSPLRSGYGSLPTLYSLDRVWTNLVLYSGWLFDTQTPLILLGLAAPFVVPRDRAEMWIVTLTTVVFPVTLLALYLPYFIFEFWGYLRFLLPAYPPLLAATAAVVVMLLRRSSRRGLAMSVTALAVASVSLYGISYSHAFNFDESRYTRVAQYVMQLPPRAVFVTLLHSGSIRYYSGRDILRWELVPPESLDTAVDYLRARGHDVYVIADDGDVEDFKRRFGNTRTVRALDDKLSVDLGGVRVIALAGSAALPTPSGR